MSPESQDTRASLLMCLRNPKSPAWEVFVSLYTPLLYYWARRQFHFPEEDAKDLVQNVFLILVKEMPSFEYQPDKGRFRGWLWTVFSRRCRQELQRRPPTPQASDSALIDGLPIPDNVDDFVARDYRNFVRRRALELIEPQVTPLQWKVFCSFVLDERESADVAAEHGLTANAVCIIICRIRKMINKQFGDLLDLR